MTRADELDPLESLWAWLAVELRGRREEHGQSQTQIGKHLGYGRAAVHNYESGIRNLDIDDAKKLDAWWSTGGIFERLVTHASREHDSGWFEQFVRYEQRARVLRIYETLVIPGLLQTPEYARAFLTAGGVEDLEGNVTRRMERQTVLDREPPPRLWVLLEESLLSRPMGSHATMRAQLGHLLNAAARPNISIRIVPTGAGGHVGLDGAFQIIETASDTVAYLEAQSGGRLDRSSKRVDRMRVTYDRIGAQALPERLSAELITRAMENMQ